jgi:two-component system chemotaxis sensor kinase CheA
MSEDARLRFKIEDMAGALTVTQTAVRNLLDNAEQGFLTIDRALVVGEQSSAACQAILGQVPAGKPIAELLCRQPDTACAMQTTLTSIFQDTSDYVRELKLGLLPAAFELDGKSIKAGYKMLGADQLMLILTDITETTRLAAQVERERLRLEMIVLAVTEGEAFGGLVEEYRQFLDTELTSLLLRIAEPGTVGELYRRIHTFKGLLAQFSFHRSPQGLHAFETALSEKSVWTVESAHQVFAPQALRTEFDKDLESITDILGQDFLSSGQRLVLTQAQLQSMKQVAAQALAKGCEVSPPVRQVLQALAGLGGLDVKSVLSLHGRGAGALAERLEKQLAPVQVEGVATSLAAESFNPFLRSLVHVFRNAVDHGIETPDARLEAGKPVEGTIHCAVQSYDKGVLIIIEDDGRGVDRALLEQGLAAKGVAPSEVAAMPLEMLMFHEGLSSRDSADQVSGRGIGLAAVKAELDRLGGNVTVETTLGSGTRLRFFLPVRLDASDHNRSSLEMAS